MARVALRLGGKRKDAVACVAQDRAVETGEALSADLLLELVEMVQFAFRAQFAGDQFAARARIPWPM